jgi:aromatic-L-amino-acid/L-tryptophan decarboxylase
MNDEDSATVAPIASRNVPLAMQPQEFRELGYQLVDALADFMGSIADRPVTRKATPAGIRELLGNGSLPEHGTSAMELMSEATELLMDHSLLNGHPRFMGYITSSPAPIGALADMLAATINPNVGAWALSPMATEIERQTVSWIAEMIGYPSDCGGLLVSGGNMANFIGVLAARRAKVEWDVRAKGLHADGSAPLMIYTSSETHTWVEKAGDLFGFGTNAVRWIPTDTELRMSTTDLRNQLDEDIAAGYQPFMVVGTAGSVSTGAIDPLPAIAEICREYDLWFHVDGAYGAFAAMLPDAPDDLKGLSLADSVALDPHKWLYSPLEAGCSLVRDARALEDAFSFHPAYYNFGGGDDDPEINFHSYGMQNSRGFRALKVWLALRQAGRSGYTRMISDDIHLAQALYQRVSDHPEFEPFTQELSITTFRYVPQGLNMSGSDRDEFLNELNTKLLDCLQAEGEVFVSNAVIHGAYVLRACIVNFRTTMADIDAIPGIIASTGKQIDAQLRAARSMPDGQ